MIVKQEMYSTNGFCKTHQIAVSDIKKGDNVILPFTQYSSVIWLNRKIYPIVFRNSELRNNAFVIIEKALDEKKSEIILDLELFYENKLSNIDVKKELVFKEYKFIKHLIHSLEYVLRVHNQEFSFLKRTDAFRGIHRSVLTKLRTEKTITINEEQIRIFSKTLRYPREFVPYISPLSFWTNLYANHVDVQLRRTTTPPIDTA